jgi:hypothetical protein
VSQIESQARAAARLVSSRRCARALSGSGWWKIVRMVAATICRAAFSRAFTIRCTTSQRVERQDPERRLWAPRRDRSGAGSKAHRTQPAGRSFRCVTRRLLPGGVALALADDWPLSARRFRNEILACWSSDAACGPAPLARLTGSHSEPSIGPRAERVRRHHHGLAALLPARKILTSFSRQDPDRPRRIRRRGMDSCGTAPVPRIIAPEAYLEGGRKAGRRWQMLEQRYALISAGRTG